MAVSNKHTYRSRVEWTGNRGSGTSAYKAYDRSWNLVENGKPVLACSNDPLLGGDPTKHNPEDMLLSALSACHMLWYLHLCSDAGIVVQSYFDQPEAVGELESLGKGRFVAACLKPVITINKDLDMDTAHALHHEIHQYCFIARSVNFPVTYMPEIGFV